jgi:hypothetical protein
VAEGGNTLAKFKMDGMASMINLAGADGTITDAELDHLIAEARARGVSEADARAYLSAYAVARGWEVGRPQRTVAPSQPQQPIPQPQPVQLSPSPQPPPDRSFRYAVAGAAALVAIAVVLAIARIELQPREPVSTPPAATALVPTPTSPLAPGPSPDQADREWQAYYAARGNAVALRAYVNSCSICAYAPDARGEVTRLETADQEERTFNAARGNKYALQVYLRTCSICADAPHARSEIAALDAPSSSTDGPGSVTESYMRNRYRKEACGSIVDTWTNLQWYLGPDVTSSWRDTVNWVRQLPACGGAWKLPTMRQLRSLFDKRLSAGTGFYTKGEYWPARIHPVFAGIGGGSWVWADGRLENGTAPAFNLNQGVPVRISPFGAPYTVRSFAVKVASPR